MEVGRPLKFQSVEELQQKIDDYFNVTPKDEWTITGLAIHLDTFRSVLCDYEEKDEFSNTIKKAKQRVENGYELDLKKHGRSGTIFALKNFDWKDKNETDVTSGGKPLPIINVIPRDHSDKENNPVEQENKDSAGWNISEQDHINTPLPDSTLTNGHLENTDLNSIGKLPPSS